MKFIAFFFGVCFLCVGGCVQLTEADEKCGPSKGWYDILEYVNGDTAGGFRTITLISNTEPEDICTVDHIKPSYFVFRRADVILPETFQFTASVSVPGFTPRTQIMTRTKEGDLTGAIEIGLAQSYKDKPGYVTMQIHAKFPTQGDYAVDVAYLESYILHGSARLDYREHKNL